jgi:hypothetical protein
MADQMRKWEEAPTQERDEIQKIVEKHLDGVRAYLRSQKLEFALLADGTTIK